MRIVGFALSIMVAAQTICFGDDKPVDQLSYGEQELVRLMTSYSEALDKYWEARQAFDTPEAEAKALQEGRFIDPNAEFISKLLVFEESHRGDDVGLLALRRIFIEAARGGNYDSHTNAGRREAVPRLHHYAKSDLLSEVAARSLRGMPDPESYKWIVELISSAALPAAAKNILRYELAVESLGRGTWHKRAKKRLEQLRAETKSQWPGQWEFEQGWLHAWEDVSDWDAKHEAAIETLKELAADKNSSRIPKYEGVDEGWSIIRSVDDPQQPRLAEKAAASLFRELSLKVGKKVPDFEVSLLDGRDWRMADQRGKVVILQFSFTGCGPCEQMYSELKEIAAEYGGKVAILSIMWDDKPDSALEGIATKKLTWNIAFDGRPGKLTSQWSVSGFPDVYVINQDGEIAAIGLRGEDLRDRVAELVGPDAK